MGVMKRKKKQQDFLRYQRKLLPAAIKFVVNHFVQVVTKNRDKGRPYVIPGIFEYVEIEPIHVEIKPI